MKNKQVRIPEIIQKRDQWLVFLALGLFLLIRTFNYHSSVFENYKKAIYADAAGYYVYLPCAFIYGFANDNMPQHLLPVLGNGFVVKEGKVITKYPYGVALLNAPAFLTAHAFAIIFGYEADGFSEVYQQAIALSAMLYLYAGLFFLYRYLRFFCSGWVINSGLLLLLFGTNLFYYAMYAPGMSHIYSFFLFSLLLFLLHTYLHHPASRNNPLYFIGIPLVVSLIFIVRNLNIIFLPFVFIVCLFPLVGVRAKLPTLFQTGRLISYASLFILFVLPQLLYNQFAYGHFFMNTYADESFLYLDSPKLAELWFSPLNGMFLYNPMLLVVVVSSLHQIFEKKYIAFFILACFLLFSYLYASWYSWFLGCAYGCRAVIDILPLLSLPFFSLLSGISGKGKKIMVYACLSLFLLINLNTLSAFDYCFNGKPDWDWFEFKKNVGEGKIMKTIFGKNLMIELQDHEKVRIKTSEGAYLLTDSQRSHVLVARHVSPEKSEVFSIIRVDEKGRVLVKNAEGYFFSADGERNDSITANRKKIGTWEIFTIHRYGGDTIALESYHGKFVHVQDKNPSYLRAVGDQAGKQEKFLLENP
jgi:hypothetical protein